MVIIIAISCVFVIIGKEVALYCAAKLGGIIKSTKSYAKGDISQALKDAFMKCDEIIMKPEIVQEMKEMMNAEVADERYVHELCLTLWGYSLAMWLLVFRFPAYM